VAGQRPLIEGLLEGVNQFLIKISNNVTGEDVGAAAQAQYIWTKGLTTPSGAIGDSEPPVPDLPAAPVGGAPVDPRNSVDDVNNLVGAILGLLGTLPDIQLPPAVCDQLNALTGAVDGTLAVDLRTQMAQLCPADGTSGPSPAPAPTPTLPPLPLPGGGDSGNSSGGVPLPLPGVGG
jgi:hypothetical protein